MPVVDGGVVLHAGVAAQPGCLSNLSHHIASLDRLDSVTRGAGLGVPVAVFEYGFHEVVGHAHRVVGVLVEDGIVSAAWHVKSAVVACIDEGPSLLLFVGLAVHEVRDVWVIHIEDDHLCSASGLAAALDHACKGIESTHEGNRARGCSATTQRLAGGTNR